MCWACGKNEATEKHHLWPIHLGGPQEGTTFFICGNCHHDTHVLANRIYANKPVDKDYPKRVVILAKAIVKAKIAMQGTQELEDAEVRMVIKIPASLRKSLHTKKADFGFTNLEDYILHLLKKGAL